MIKTETKEEKLNRLTASAKQIVKRFFEGPENKEELIRFVKVKNWARDNNIKEVLEEIDDYYYIDDYHYKKRRVKEWEEAALETGGGTFPFHKY
jgi:hypothetical protein